MRIASYNVNGINGRLEVVLKWLAASKPDIVCLQELKAPHHKFPIEAINEAGYNAIWKGQSQWNGVAILSKFEIKEIGRELPGDEHDIQSRYIEAMIEGLVVACLYLPNGNPSPGPKFDYKLEWFNRLQTRAQQLLEFKTAVLLVGDFNVMPAEIDVYKPEKYRNDALFRAESRDAFLKLLNQGWTDAIRFLHPDQTIYTFWDYFRNAYTRNAGLRIDHFLTSPELQMKLKAAGVDKEVRGWEKTSDHAPVWLELKNE